MPEVSPPSLRLQRPQRRRSSARWATAGAGEPRGAATRPATRALAGCWRLFAPVTASGCCRSVEPKETAARASTAQDGGFRVSVSVCGGHGGRAGRGAPSRSFAAGGGRRVGALRAGQQEREGGRGGGGGRGTPPPRAPQRKFPSPPCPAQGEQRAPTSPVLRLERGPS